MIMKRIYIYAVLVAFCLVLQFQAIAQYQIPKSTLGNGGIPIGNTAFQLNSTLGQHVIGVTSDADYQSHLGFWYGGGAVSSDSITWETNLLVADAGNSSVIIKFGQAPTASDSLDNNLGETELPPLPPMGIFDARFQLPTSSPVYTLIDYRHDGNETATWKFKFQPSTAGYPFKISWNTSELPPGNFIVKDEITGHLIKVDMKGVDNVVVTNSAINSLLIEMTKVTWKANLVVADAGNNSITLTFGQAPDAGDDLDPLLGEVELPPPPPQGVIDARFALPGTTIFSLKDFRNEADQSILWRFRFQDGSGGFPITLSWNSEELPDIGGFYLKDELTGYLININMKDQNSYKVTNSAFTSLAIEMTSEIIREVKVAAGWNLLSVPVLAADMNAKTLFSKSASYAFRFANGYLVEDTLVNGTGYWLKFNQADTVQISGQPVVNKHIPVNADWNIIGPFEDNVRASDITSEPAGIIKSDYFEFENGYKVVTSLVVGKGYWVKASQAGTLKVTTGTNLNKVDIPMIAGLDQNLLDELPRIIFEDRNGQCVVLYLGLYEPTGWDYELPPIPPAGVFDVRYSSGRFIESVSKQNPEIMVTSAQYPVQIRAENLNGNLLHLTDLSGGKVLNQTVREGEKIEIFQPITRMLLSAKQATSNLPEAYNLNQNYPNPFNPTTVINYALPKDGHVRISVYDILGKKLADLVDAEMPAGHHLVEFHAQDFSSGVYFYVMKSGDFKSVKKMIIIK